jgi:hypothetical protein
MPRFFLEMAGITFLVATWYLLYRVAHVIVTEYGLLGGFIAFCVIYATALVMERYS